MGFAHGNMGRTGGRVKSEKEKSSDKRARDRARTTAKKAEAAAKAEAKAKAKSQPSKPIDFSKIGKTAGGGSIVDDRFKPKETVYSSTEKLITVGTAISREEIIKREAAVKATATAKARETKTRAAAVKAAAAATAKRIAKEKAIKTAYEKSQVAKGDLKKAENIYKANVAKAEASLKKYNKERTIADKLTGTTSVSAYAKAKADSLLKQYNKDLSAARSSYNALYDKIEKEEGSRKTLSTAKEERFTPKTKDTPLQQITHIFDFNRIEEIGLPKKDRTTKRIQSGQEKTTAFLEKRKQATKQLGTLGYPASKMLGAISNVNQMFTSVPRAAEAVVKKPALIGPGIGAVAYGSTVGTAQAFVKDPVQTTMEFAMLGKGLHMTAGKVRVPTKPVKISKTAYPTSIKRPQAKEYVDLADANRFNNQFKTLSDTLQKPTTLPKPKKVTVIKPVKPPKMTRDTSHIQNIKDAKTKLTEKKIKKEKDALGTEKRISTMQTTMYKKIMKIEKNMSKLDKQIKVSRSPKEISRIKTKISKENTKLKDIEKKIKTTYTREFKKRVAELNKFIYSRDASATLIPGKRTLVTKTKSKLKSKLESELKFKHELFGDPIKKTTRMKKQTHKYVQKTRSKYGKRGKIKREPVRRGSIKPKSKTNIKIIGKTKHKLFPVLRAHTIEYSKFDTITNTKQFTDTIEKVKDIQKSKTETLTRTETKTDTSTKTEVVTVTKPKIELKTKPKYRRKPRIESIPRLPPKPIITKKKVKKKEIDAKKKVRRARTDVDELYVKNKIPTLKSFMGIK